MSVCCCASECNTLTPVDCKGVRRDIAIQLIQLREASLKCVHTSRCAFLEGAVHLDIIAAIGRHC